MYNPTVIIEEDGTQIKVSHIFFSIIQNIKDTVTLPKIRMIKKQLLELLNSDTQVNEKLLISYLEQVDKMFDETFKEEHKDVIDVVLTLLEEGKYTDFEELRAKKTKRKLLLEYPVVIIGHQCAGKTSLSKELKSRGLKVAKMTTDRPKRNKKETGYQFVDVFDESKYVIKKSYQIDDNTIFNYGLTKRMVRNSNVFDLNPSQIQDLIDHVGKVFVVHLDVDRDTLKSRYDKDHNRNYDSFDRRYEAFEGVEMSAFKAIDHSNYIKITVEDVDQAINKLFFYSK